MSCCLNRCEIRCPNPDFIKPAQGRWIEVFPNDARWTMERAATDDPTWEQHVSNPEAIEA